jgi:ribosome biogenesis GTPase
MAPPSSGAQSAVAVRVDFGSCLLLGDDGVAFEAIVRGRLMGVRKALGNVLVVGDRVQVERERGRVVVTGVHPRRNHFSRRESGARGAEQVVASNLDQVVVVAAVLDPEFKPGFADRVLCQAEHAGIPARLVLNKIDLAAPDRSQSILEDYTQAGYAVEGTSVKTGHGVEHLRRVCRGRRSLLVGHSGVGKSSLLNALMPGLNLLARQVNPKTGKGRHTTTAAWLIRPEPELELIDTPGVRVFGLWGIGARDQEQAYPEFRRHLGDCRFSDCRHVGEPECALLQAVERGDISRRRYESFLKLRDELEQEGTRP